MATLVTTGFKPATTVLENGPGVNAWDTPDNILLTDGQFAVANAATDILTIGNFNHNLPQDAIPTAITVNFKGYRGAFATTLNIYAIDDSTGVEYSFPYTPAFNSFTGVNTVFTLTPTLFATTWTADAINNIKFRLIADGELHMDYFSVDVQYAVPDPVVPVPDTGDGEEVCNEYVQAQPFRLAQSVSSTDLFMFLESFNYPSLDGTGDPILFADFQGPDALLVIDQGEPAEENVRITSVEHNYNGTGLVRIGFDNLSNRGLDMKYPYTSVASRIYPHTGTAEVVISNSAPFYDRFLKKCHINALVSEPIEVQDEGVTITEHVHVFNFTGGGVTVVPDAGDNDIVEVIIPAAGDVTPPQIDTTSSTTSGNVQVPDITWQHTTNGVNRGMLVQVSMEGGKTVTGVTYNGVPLTFEVAAELNDARVEQWSLLAPPVGTYDIVVTFSADSYVSCGAETFVNVDQTDFTASLDSATGNSNTPSLVHTTTVNNSLVVDGLSTAQTPIVLLPGAGQTENWSHYLNTDTRQGASSLELAGVAPDNVTMDWSITQITDWALASVEVRGIQPTLSSLEVEDEGVIVDSNVINIDFVGAGVTVIQTSPGNVEVQIPGGGGGGGINMFVDQTPDSGTYGLLAGAVDGLNTTFTVSEGIYETGKLQVFLNGLIQEQGATEDWVETTPGSGIFDFNTAPAVNDIITVVYTTTSGGNLEIEDEGVSVETNTTLINFIGAGVTAASGGAGIVNVTIPGGGGGAANEVTKDVTQVGHGFSVGQVIRSSGTDGEYALAIANSAANADAVGIVTAVAGPDDFTYGKIVMGYSGAGIPAIAANNQAWLSPTVAGAMTGTEPAAIGQVRKPLGAVTANGAEMDFDATLWGELITSSSSGTVIAGGDQDVPLCEYNTSNSNSRLAVPTTSSDLTYMYSVTRDEGTSNQKGIHRFVKDSTTGIYRFQEFVDLSVSSGEGSVATIVQGDFMYAFVTASTVGNSVVVKFNKDDLTTSSDLTPSDTSQVNGASTGLFLKDGNFWSYQMVSGSDYVFQEWEESGANMNLTGSTFTLAGLAAIGNIEAIGVINGQIYTLLDDGVIYVSDLSTGTLITSTQFFLSNSNYSGGFGSSQFADMQFAFGYNDAATAFELISVYYNEQDTSGAQDREIYLHKVQPFGFIS